MDKVTQRKIHEMSLSQSRKDAENSGKGERTTDRNKTGSS